MTSVRDALRCAPLVEDVPGLRLLKVGDGWDFVRTSAGIGLLALAYLRAAGTPIGPVLYDRTNGRLYYAITTGTAGDWGDLPVRHLSANSWLVAPGLENLDAWSAAGANPTTTPSPTPPPSAPHFSTRTSPPRPKQRIPMPSSTGSPTGAFSLSVMFCPSRLARGPRLSLGQPATSRTYTIFQTRSRRDACSRREPEPRPARRPGQGRPRHRRDRRHPEPPLRLPAHRPLRPRISLCPTGCGGRVVGNSGSTASTQNAGGWRRHSKLEMTICPHLTTSM
ncbi:hypothetical protein MBT84_20675 [Streptomyces sp. MBT84]|nr:hypothetical protein [Streptomyces sp. MBT84]